eukprot:Protomagalhaensia_wolfi_Nauph_80__1420@NODE_1852_length_1308_cov_87_141056_g1445_i0_p2_GENE_NODE_1852_length_1308_cov_87_141056_g1445_i0NODE_1852_length_1308_cov_87_141056_g1445_i0_p2_ORF_typecomplete_len172_score22_32_NODE_1852_length_1308_cov_87_141056_g1445_i07451260
MMNTSNTMVLADFESVEWQVVSAYLALCSRSTRVRLVSLWHVQISTALNQFNKRSTNKSVLPCWINVKDLDQNTNSSQEVCRRGFQLSDSGLMVHYGSLHLPMMPTFLFKSQQPVRADGNASTSPFSPSQHARDPIFQQWNKDQEALSLMEKGQYELFLCDVCETEIGLGG